MPALITDASWPPRPSSPTLGNGFFTMLAIPHAADDAGGVTDAARRRRIAMADAGMTLPYLGRLLAQACSA
jgi:hypothetical protein